MLSRLALLKVRPAPDRHNRRPADAVPGKFGRAIRPPPQLRTRLFDGMPSRGQARIAGGELHFTGIRANADPAHLNAHAAVNTQTAITRVVGYSNAELEQHPPAPRRHHKYIDPSTDRRRPNAGSIRGQPDPGVARRVRIRLHGVNRKAFGQLVAEFADQVAVAFLETRDLCRRQKSRHLEIVRDWICGRSAMAALSIRRGSSDRATSSAAWLWSSGEAEMSEDTQHRLSKSAIKSSSLRPAHQRRSAPTHASRRASS